MTTNGEETTSDRNVEIWKIDLLEYFGKFGNITNVTIVTDKDSGQRKGFGFIEYDDTDSVDKAVCE